MRGMTDHARVSGAGAAAVAALLSCAAPAAAQDRAAATAAWAPVADERLDTVTGRGDVQQTVANALKGNVSDNTINGDVATGGVGFGTGAFGNASGVFVVTSNTGNNVAVNAALNLNVTVRP